MRLLACAINFGLGPAGKLCSIVCGNKNHQWYACGDKLDISLYKKNPFVDYCWSKDKNILEQFIKINDIKHAVNVLDPELAITLKSLGVKVIYIDSLPFMWNELDIIPYEVDYYCAQKYPGFVKNPVLEKVKNLLWVDPIVINCSEPNISNNKIVINFGGLHSPYGDGQSYIELILKSLLKIVPLEKICVTGGDNVVRLTNNLFPEISCHTYVHEQFLNLVLNSELFFTSPGLTTIYETCNMNIKTIILPPQNLSQFYNSAIAQAICSKVKVLNWGIKELSLEHILSQFKNSPEGKTVEYIYNQITLLSKNHPYTNRLCNSFRRILEQDYSVNKLNYLTGNGVSDISKLIEMF